ncbi:unnamed protein product, partial [Closterium sp. NIES-54]
PKAPRPLILTITTAATATATTAAATAASAAPADCTTMALLQVLAFDHEGRQALYDAVVARYSSPATAALGRLLLPYLFPDLSAFATVEDLVSHLRASDARYRAAVPAEGAPPPPLPPPTPLLLLQTSLMLTTSELLLLVQSAAVARARMARVVEVAAVVVEVAAGVVVGAAVEVVAAVGPLEGVGALVAAVEAALGVAALAAVRLLEVGLALTVLVLEVASVSSSSVGARTRHPSSFTCRRSNTQHRLNDAWRAEFGDDVELPRWADLLKSRIAIFDLDFDAILSTMYALCVSAEGDCYRCVPPDPGIAAAPLGASESRTLPGTTPAPALHTFTLDSGASRCFFCDSTTLTPLPTPVPVRLADPSGGLVVARSSTVLPCLAVLSGSLSGLHLLNLVSTAALQDAMVTTTTLGGQRVSICTCTWTGRHLATFTRRPGSSLYTLATEPSQVAVSA